MPRAEKKTCQAMTGVSFDSNWLQDIAQGNAQLIKTAPILMNRDSSWGLYINLPKGFLPKSYHSGTLSYIQQPPNN